MTQPTTTPAEIEALCKRLEEIPIWMVGEMTPGWQDHGTTAYEAAAKLREMAGALNGYRAAVSFISADSWDGGSDCMDILKAARTNDLGWDWAHKPDRVAEELAHIRPFIPALAGGSHG